MKNLKHQLVFFLFLSCGIQLCNAQQEDTLRLAPIFIPPLINPGQIQMPNHPSLMPDMLGLDGLDYIPSRKKDTASLTPSLSIENFQQFYNDDFLDWEFKTYGWNFDLHQLTHKSGKYLAPAKYTPLKKDANDIPEAPYPLHPQAESPPAISIPIRWGSTKHDEWYAKNFSWEKRIIYNNVSVAQYGYRDVTEYKIFKTVDSIIQRRKIELGGTYNPDLSKLKKRIRLLKYDIKHKAKFELNQFVDSLR